MEVFGVLSSVSLGEGVNLDPEGDALLSAVLPGSELCADAVHLKVSAESDRGFRNEQRHAKEVREELVWDTCTKTEVLFFMSHRNSAALSWEGWVFGSTMPTDMGISEPTTNAHFYSRNARKSRNNSNAVQSAGAFTNHIKIQILFRFILPSQSLFTGRANS